MYSSFDRQEDSVIPKIILTSVAGILNAAGFWIFIDGALNGVNRTYIAGPYITYFVGLLFLTLYDNSIAQQVLCYILYYYLFIHGFIRTERMCLLNWKAIKGESDDSPRTHAVARALLFLFVVGIVGSLVGSLCVMQINYIKGHRGDQASGIEQFFALLGNIIGMILFRIAKAM